MVRMTREAINFCIKRKELKRNPELNHKLYLSNQSFSDIASLDRFTQVNALFLSRNSISKIENLEPLRELKVLNLSNNKIDEIENLACCAKLRLVDLSKNEISFVSDHLSLCEKLETLQLSHNKLSTAKSISNIVSIPKLHELDLSKNKLDGEYGSFLDILSECKHLKVLSLKGNPVIKNMPHYRRMVVSRCKGLTVLDGNEVCREERRRCNAWGAVISKGGTFNDAQEADRRELIKILSEQSDKNAEERQMKAMTRRLSDVPQSKPPLKASALSPTTWGLGYVALELKPRSSLVSTCLKKAFDYLNPALQRSSISEKEPLLFEDADGSIKGAKKTRKNHSSTRTKSFSSSCTATETQSPLFQDVPTQPTQPPDNNIPTSHSQATTTRSSSSSNSSLWSKVSQQEFEYRERNSFLLLPPPPPPRTPIERRTIV